MPNVDVLVTVQEERRADMDKVAKSLEEKGLQEVRRVPRSRAIVGTGDSSQLESLKSVEGVEDVRPQHQFQLPPMDEKIPQ
jgi:hypothetical protein